MGVGDRFNERRRGGPYGIRVLADVVLAVVMILFTITFWSPTTATNAISLGLKVLLPVAAILLILRATGWSASKAS
jgi:hypothetical protein